MLSKYPKIIIKISKLFYIMYNQQIQSGDLNLIVKKLRISDEIYMKIFRTH